MVYSHLVKYNGVYYPAGTNVPVGVASVEIKDNKIIDEVKEEIKYTKTDINRMSTSDLKSLAKSEGIKDADTLSGADLKKVLIEKFGL
jgi:hypothetical protein